MILFIADYPTVKNIRDGMFQRIAAIDSLTKNENRIYLNISFRKNMKRSVAVFENCRVENLNYFLHYKTIKKYLKKASVIYVHSVYNMLKIYSFNEFNKTILDIHGVVPEEMMFLGKKTRSFIYNKVEEKAVSSCYKLIHVTAAMKKFYEEKYNLNLDEKSIVLPIFEKTKIQIDHSKWNRNVFEFIYAGGMQAWQNIDLMIEESAKIFNKNIKLNFFFPQNLISEFKKRCSTHLESRTIIVDSLPKEDVIKVMARCHLGFVLRDDIIVNRVACPTKLIEYLECGVVPIVKSPDIGDFHILGYSYIKAEELNNVLSMDDLRAKVENNYKVLADFQTLTEKSKLKLVNIFKNTNNSLYNK
ncbi:glycosyl transferase family 2 [Citrobacter freundii]|uniref:glycosyl transferase family 2 n=2 Tax=Citrobacter freundii TaxID=546 RepID=UPI000B22D9F0|nr:glycosyl transferase family 2 [Citrobacter freundii]EIN8655918.1 glycosyl transferase family 2 [Citrobacter freundii]EJD6419590.1 glycosyl transferase family 2 [Citrobacter freundii]EJD6623184.1 glycosyl transferase family 2 [Citrobacter freundii]HBZ9065986.1 glycosyl transferase family 2 [Citrobacter freundii]HBZ9381658.1 glycosyl transferase family 2 [Citrobacter freundii]